MLTDEQKRNGLINTESRWAFRNVPYVIDDVFSEYCSTKLQTGLRAWREISIYFQYLFNCSAHWSLTGRRNDNSYLSLPPKTHTHRHTLMSNQPHKHTLDPQITITSKLQILLNTTKSGRFQFNMCNLTSTVTVSCTRSLPVSPLYFIIIDFQIFRAKPDKSYKLIIYSHAPYNDISVNDGPHIRRWSHCIILN